jgi:hypothetical protein
MIIIEFEGVKYEVDLEAYETDKILLPDGRLLQVQGWHESHPPKPVKLCEVKHNFKGTAVETANYFGAVLAVRVITFGEMTNEVHRLDQLLQDQNPGLTTWNEAVLTQGRTVRDILKIHFPEN